jgi:transcription antitermination factor NusG
MESQNKWFVVYTRPKWEKKVASLLEKKGIEYYCPLNRVLRQWSDRKKTILEPLFKGYIFVKVEEANKWDVKKINGVINFVYWLGRPAVVKEKEIETIKKFLNEFTEVEVVDLKLNLNNTVIINKGILMNYKGIVINVLGNKARVQIDSMGIKLSAVFDKKDLSLV